MSPWPRRTWGAMLLGAALLAAAPTTATETSDPPPGPVEWGLVAILAAFSLAVVVVDVICRWRGRNPHTKLPRPLRRRRARGPLRHLK